MRIQAGDAVIVNGGHGATILAARGALVLRTDIPSDRAGLGHWMQAVSPRLASSLNEKADAAGLSVEIDEALLPLRPRVVGV